MPLPSKPQLFVITGSNGAGKSTLKQALLPVDYQHLEVFDGDIFYSKKRNEFYKIYKSDKEAKKLADEALEEHFIELTAHHLNHQIDFAYEGHFTGPGAWAVLEKFKLKGFRVNLIFCGLDNVTKSIQRVDIRVKKNGFHVPPLDIENNFYGNMEMVNRNYRILDTIEVIDTSGSILPVCSISGNEIYTPLLEEDVPKWFKSGLPNLFDLIYPTNDPKIGEPD